MYLQAGRFQWQIGHANALVGWTLGGNKAK